MYTHIADEMVTYYGLISKSPYHIYAICNIAHLQIKILILGRSIKHPGRHSMQAIGEDEKHTYVC